MANECGSHINSFVWWNDYKIAEGNEVISKESWLWHKQSTAGIFLQLKTTIFKTRWPLRRRLPRNFTQKINANPPSTTISSMMKDGNMFRLFTLKRLVLLFRGFWTFHDPFLFSLNAIKYPAGVKTFWPNIVGILLCIFAINRQLPLLEPMRVYV